MKTQFQITKTTVSLLLLFVLIRLAVPSALASLEAQGGVNHTSHHNALLVTTPTPTPSPTCPSDPIPSASLSATPISLQVGDIVDLTFATNLGIPAYTLYDGQDRIATYLFNGDITIYNESAIIEAVPGTVAAPQIRAIDAGSIDLRLSVNGEIPFYYFDPSTSECQQGFVFRTAVSDIVPLTITYPADCTPFPPASINLSVEDSTLNVGETTDITFSSNLGIPVYTLYDGADVLAVYPYGGDITIHNESPLIEVMPVSPYRTLTGVTSGTANLRLSAFGETFFRMWNPETQTCLFGSYFTTITSDSIPVTIVNNPPTCQVNYNILSQWNSGFQANIMITNNDAAPVEGYDLVWDFPNGETFSYGWNANYSQSGSTMTAGNVQGHWNGTIQANGGNVTFGFIGNHSGTVGIPSSFSLNGAACSS